MYKITAVRTVRPLGATHPHISHVRLLDGTVETRSQVIYWITQKRMTYVTWAVGVPEAKVIVARCPICRSGDYITTEPDSTTHNNLLDLPRF